MTKHVIFDSELEGIWNKFPKENPFLSFSWHETWFSILGNGWEPYILTGDDVVAPLARKDNLIIFSGDKDVTDYHDLLGNFDRWPEILEYLKKDEITQLRFESLPENSKTLKFFKIKVQEEVTPILELPRNWEQYLEKLDRKERHELKRKVKRFEESFSGIAFNNTVDLNNLFKLMVLSPEKKEFLTQERRVFFEKITESLKENVLQTNMMINNSLVATTLAFIYDKTVYLYNSGFDQENYPGAGFYLNAMLIKQAIERGDNTYNFLRGGERYKHELGGVDLPIYTASLDLI